eukprot:g14732.t1
MMNGNGFGGSGSSGGGGGGRSGTDGTTNSGSFQQGGFYSGGYALPGVFGDSGQAPGEVFSIFSGMAAPPAGGAGACSSSVETSTPMVLAHTPPRPLPAASVAWGGAATATPRVLFAPGYGHGQQHLQVHSENPCTATNPLQFQQQQQQQRLGGIGPTSVLPPNPVGGDSSVNVSTASVIPGGAGGESPAVLVGGGGLTVLPPPLQQPSQPSSCLGGALVPPPASGASSTGFTFNAAGGDDSSAAAGAADKLSGPAFVAGYNGLVPQQQLQAAAPIFTTPTPTGRTPSGYGGEQQQVMTMVPKQPQQQQQLPLQQPGAAPAAAAASVQFPPHAFLQLNPLYPGLRTLWETPPLYVVDDFFTAPECDALMALASNYMIASPVVGAGAGEVSESRTSSSCFLAREDLPTVCRKVVALTGKPFEHLELPQVGRYYTSQKYANHWDAFDLNTEDGRRFAQNGGQRVCTVLVYLNDVASGGCTAFPQLGMKVQPKKGMAVVFFPATLEGILDSRLLHAAEPAIDTKWVSQIWIRQGPYSGTPTARIPAI